MSKNQASYKNHAHNTFQPYPNHDGILCLDMRELLYNAAEHFKRAQSFMEHGQLEKAKAAYEDALKDLHAVRPQRMRDVLLAQVYLSRYQTNLNKNTEIANQDLRLGYSYAKTTREPAIRSLAENLWTTSQLTFEQKPPER